MRLQDNNYCLLVASVSCIYGIGSPDEYEGQMISLRPGIELPRRKILKQLIDIQYTRNDIDFDRGSFRARGDIIDIYPAGADHAIEGTDRVYGEIVGG